MPVEDDDAARTLLGDEAGQPVDQLPDVRVAAGVEEVVAVEEVEGRVRHRRLPPRLVQQHGGRHRHVQRLDPSGERDRHGGVARAPDERPQPLPLRAEHEGQSPGQVRFGHGRPGRVGGVDPELRPLHLVQVARQVGDDCDRQVLDRAGGRARDRRRHPRRVVRRAGRRRSPPPPRRERITAPRLRGSVTWSSATSKRLAGGELVRVRVAERLDARDHALVVAGPGELGQRLLRDDLRLSLPVRRAPRARSRAARAPRAGRAAPREPPAARRRAPRHRSWPRPDRSAAGMVGHRPARSLDARPARHRPFAQSFAARAVLASRAQLLELRGHLELGLDPEEVEPARELARAPRATPSRAALQARPAC